MPRATDVGWEDTKDADETYQGLYYAVSINHCALPSAVIKYKLKSQTYHFVLGGKK